MDIFKIVGRITTEYADALKDLEKVSDAAGDTADNFVLLNKESEKTAESIVDSSEESEDALDELRHTVKDQEDELKKLRDEYANVILEQGKNSDEAETLQQSIKNLSDELSDNQERLDKAESAASDLSESFEDADENARNTEGGFSVMKGAISNLISDGINKAVESLEEFITASDKASNSFQAKTGATAEEMEKINAEIADLYENNYGESLEDIGDAMATVAQNSKETDPTHIKDLTKNAIILRDTFGYEVSESMRAANMIIDQFGLSGEEAFNLIAQGAQNGLDKNGDLLDTINEYGVHYSQQGYSAEEFFNSLKNGTDAGTFSVDKLGDAMKEFGIRVKDNSDSSAAAFSQIGVIAEDKGKTAKDFFARFAAGGDEARNATSEVLEALLNMDDQVAQNEAGVALFGTMWEDLGIDGVKALMDVNGEADKTSTTMQDIDSVKYNDVGSQLQTLGRKIKTELIDPIVEKLLPPVKKGVEWLTSNLPVVEAVIVGIGTAIATYFIATTVITFITAFKTGTTVIAGFKAGFAALNITMAANPIGILITLLAALVAVFIYLWNKCDWFREFWTNVWNQIVDKLRPIGDTITLLFSTALEQIKGVWDKVSGFFQGVWDGIVAVFLPVAGWFSDKFKNAWNGIKNAFSTVGKFFSGLWEEIKKPFVSIADWFKEKFQNAWEGVKNVFSTGGRIFEGIKEGISGVFTTVVNGIIKGINWIIKQPFDKIKDVLGFMKGLDFWGWQPFDWFELLPVPQIPELAEGGILPKGKTGYLEGDGAEAVVPLEKNTEWTGRVADLIVAHQQSVPQIDTAVLDKLTEIIKLLKAQNQSGNGINLTVNIGSLNGEDKSDIDKLVDTIKRELYASIYRDKIIWG